MRIGTHYSLAQSTSQINYNKLLDNMNYIYLNRFIDNKHLYYDKTWFVITIITNYNFHDQGGYILYPPACPRYLQADSFSLVYQCYQKLQ